MSDSHPPEPHLADFIRAHLEPILAEWETFAKSALPARQMDASALRDHAEGMLLAIADDMQAADGDGACLPCGTPTASERSQAASHGAARVASGFSVSEAVSEFRALRASVLRLWGTACAGTAPNAPDQALRFNQALDQALGESLERYALDKDESTRRFDTLLSASPDLHYIVDRDATFQYANRTLARLFERSVEDVVGHNIDTLCPALAAALRDDIEQVLAGGEPKVGELTCHADPGRPVTYRNVLIPVAGESGRIDSITGSARNISELKESEEIILRHAYYDSLTELPNRLLFRDRLAQELKHACRTGTTLALLYLDLDGFKEVNDRYGHLEGDVLLRAAARRIAGCVRNSDTVARLGGDEFTVILTQVSKSARVEIQAQQLLEELARPFSIQGKELHISCSIGITLAPQDAAVPEDLVRNADQAMFVAKKAGKNRFSFFTACMREAAWERVRIIDELRQALASHQLEVYYQPIVDMRSGAIVKAEALVRWHHPQDGLVMPARFIGLAEETGLIGEIGAAVVRDAVVHARHWSAKCGLPFQISVNKSPAEFLDRSLLRSGDPNFTQLQAAAAQVAVEITEGIMLSDSPMVRDKLCILKQAGVQFAIDDFGVGYSSLAYLKKFRVDFLKIDQSFVKDMLTNFESGIFAETIIHMAHRLGLKVIAEGVETEAQRDWLAAAGCDYAQGFLYSEATSAERFEQLLTKR